MHPIQHQSRHQSQHRKRHQKQHPAYPTDTVKMGCAGLWRGSVPTKLDMKLGGD